MTSPAPWRTILVPHDFSSCANHAAAIARDQAKLSGASLVLLHVVDVPLALGPDTMVILPSGETQPIGIREYATVAAQDRLVDIAERLRRDGVEVTTIVRSGVPDEQIIAYVEEQNATATPVDLVVIGTHGRRGLRRLALGSVAERVVRASPVPVLTVRQTA